jgi:ribosomal protein L7/L12
MDKTFRRFMESLTDDQLANLAAVANIEVDHRILVRFEAGDYPPPTVEELLLVKEHKIKAIMKYRERTKCSLRLAKMVMEKQ